LNYESQKGESEESEDWGRLVTIKAVIKEIRKQYGTILKRLAD
jgi:hypothetical protein